MDDYLQTANLALEEWHKKCRDLQQEKESLLKEMDEAKEKRDTEIDSLNRELSEYIQQMAELNENSTPNYGKTIEQLSERQRLRRITELKGRADLALRFLESHGLKLTVLKSGSLIQGENIHLTLEKETVTQED